MSPKIASMRSFDSVKDEGGEVGAGKPRVAALRHSKKRRDGETGGFLVVSANRAEFAEPVSGACNLRKKAHLLADGKARAQKSITWPSARSFGETSVIVGSKRIGGASRRGRDLRFWRRK